MGIAEDLVVTCGLDVNHLTAYYVRIMFGYFAVETLDS